MRRLASLVARIALGVAALSLVAACAGAPASQPAPAPAQAAPQPAAQPAPQVAPQPAPQPPPPPVPVRKERTIVVKTPVVLKETLFYPDGLVDEYTVYTYDPSYQRLLTKATFDPSRADPVERVVSEYSAAGVLIDELTYGSDGALKSKRETAYGADKATAGLLLSERWLDAKNLPQGSSSYEYDSNRRKTVWKAFDAKGSLKAITNYKYDDKGRLVLIELRNAAASLTGSIKVEYAADGTTEKRSYIGSDGNLQKAEVSILKNGKVVRFEIRRPDNSLAEASDYSLGPLGERLATVTGDGSGKVKEKRSAEFTVREDQQIEVYYE